MTTNTKTMDEIKAELEQVQVRIGAAWLRALQTLAATLEETFPAQEDKAEEEDETPDTFDTNERQPKFKVGDRVTCSLCGTAAVTEIDYNEYHESFTYRTDDNRTGKHLESELTLAEPQRPEPKFKRGDWVRTRILKNTARIVGDPKPSQLWGRETWEYRTRFRDGTETTAYETAIEAGSPPAPRFKVGDRVKYRGYRGWRPATITKVVLDEDNDYRFDFGYTDNIGGDDYDYDYDFGADENADLVLDN